MMINAKISRKTNSPRKTTSMPTTTRTSSNINMNIKITVGEAFLFPGPYCYLE